MTKFAKKCNKNIENAKKCIFGIQNLLKHKNGGQIWIQHEISHILGTPHFSFCVFFNIVLKIDTP